MRFLPLAADILKTCHNKSDSPKFPGKSLFLKGDDGN
jgi:hypothetical protein